MRPTGSAARRAAPTGQSRAEVGSGIVGGGWLACFGYDPKTTTLAFYDSLLRWQRDDGWSFESLGLRGRERRTRQRCSTGRRCCKPRRCTDQTTAGRTLQRLNGC